jgi:hypothetical protein
MFIRRDRVGERSAAMAFQVKKVKRLEPHTSELPYHPHHNHNQAVE